MNITKKKKLTTKRRIVGSVPHPQSAPFVRASRRQNNPPAEVTPPAMSRRPGCFDLNSGGQVDREDPAPVHVLYKVAAQRRADCGGHQESDAENSHGTAELGAGDH